MYEIMIGELGPSRLYREIWFRVNINCYFKWKYEDLEVV